MLSVEAALQLVLDHARPGSGVVCPIGRARGLVLDEGVSSDVDSPPHDKSLVDGYALRSADILAGLRRLAVVEEITAGVVPSREVLAGQCARIMTGAPLPAGADAVVMVEQTQPLEGGGRVQIDSAPPTPGQNIMRRATSMARGQQVLRHGSTLRSIEIGLLAEVGRAHIRVLPRPRVAVVSTGNELVPADQVPGPGQIRNSNGALLVAATEAAGADGRDLGIARDDTAALASVLANGLQDDLLVISGGVSAGVLDLVPGVLADLGVRQVFHKVNLKPGKPLWFGVAERGHRAILVFGLPGNPVSSLVCCQLFVRPAIARLAGREPQTRLISVPLAADYVQRGTRVTYHPARFIERDGRRLIEPLSWRGSGDLRTLVDADALACFPAGDRQFSVGEMIGAQPL